MFTRTRDRALSQISDGLESTDRKVHRIRIRTSRTCICNCDSNGFAVVRIGNSNLLSTEWRRLGNTAITPQVWKMTMRTLRFYRKCYVGLTDGRNKVAIRMDCTTSTSKAVLREKRCAESKELVL